MVERKAYLSALTDYQGTKTIKVITGMRRCGKSSLLLMFMDKLAEQGVKKENITYINFESLKYSEYNEYKKLYQLLATRIAAGKMNYILLDEIQQVESWEKAINSLLVDYPDEIDIYITGSNAHLLSSELATLLSGRYVEIKMLPLSFKEYLLFDEGRPEDDKLSVDEKFQDYLRYGSLPVLFDHKKSDSIFNDLLLGIYNTVLLKDVIQRNKINDTVLLDNVVHFALDNIGKIMSSKKISDYLSSDKKKTTHVTILNYIEMLEKAYIFYPVRRYDIKGKSYLKTLEKHYVVDIGIRNTVLGYRNTDMGHILENIVFLELLRRGYEVCMGKYNDYEIDFVASKYNDKRYYQVAQSIIDEKILERECRPLEALKDNYEKTILSMDRSYVTDKNGIRFKNIIEFLMED